ncbi:MAG TPA: phosphoribosyltransferase family protein [Streptosporangiaceae bacterium]|nr:phosphoribosyltransferase family protein [Streptosporangiaceae bacterium]
MVFVDRADAGRHLARRLRHLRGTDAVVLGLPRGGVPVAFEVAQDLRAPLDVIVVRKLGVPYQPEYGFGAIGEDGARVIDAHVVRQTGLTPQEIADVEAAGRVQLDRLVSQLRGGRPAVPVAGRTVIVTDDGVATGSTARAACAVARARGARRVVLAVPVGSPASVAALRRDADEVICLHAPARFFAVGEWYSDFAQVTDEEVTALLDKAAAYAGACEADADPAEIAVDVAGVRLAGSLVIPGRARGLVVFAHGSGSSRHSPRNQFVATALNRAGLGTLLVDLLTADEAVNRAYVFNIALLAARLEGITSWVRSQPAAVGTPVGYFGASTGAAAALWAAAGRSPPVAAIVSRGGRPDLAGRRLALVRAPTLLIVGGADEVVLDLNRQAQAQLVCESRLEVIPGATHLFSEPGALEQVADLAAGWFTGHIGMAGQAEDGAP